VRLVSRFEDLEAWREARKLTAQVYEVVDGTALRRDFVLGDQLRRASISTMNNIAEGFDSTSRLEFRRFLTYAARSASEVQSCLYVALDRAYIDRGTFERIYAQARSVRRLCSGIGRRLATYSRSQRDGGGHVREDTAPYTAPCTGSPVHRLIGSPETAPNTGSPAHRLTGARCARSTP
jgi:four helix bundle protein